MGAFASLAFEPTAIHHKDLPTNESGENKEPPTVCKYASDE
jgi:hypothetical protein